MSPAPNDLFLAVTTADGSVYHTTRQTSGSWSAFTKLSNLTQIGRKNIGVTVSYRPEVCALNNAALRQLRYTKDPTGVAPAVLVRAGVAPTSAEIAGGSLSLAILGIGPPTVPGWSFGLPLTMVKTDQTVVKPGDELANFDAGVLDPSDPPLTLAIAGTFDDTKKNYHLMLSNTKALYHAHRGDSGSARFDVGFTESVPIVSASCSLGFDGLHVCWVVGGGILHAIRSPAGAWNHGGLVNQVTGTTETFTRVAISHYDLPGGKDGILHVVGVTSSGGLFYANRTAENTADPLWTTFLDVKKAGAGDKGSVTSVDIAVQP